MRSFISSSLNGKMDIDIRLETVCMLDFSMSSLITAHAFQILFHTLNMRSMDVLLAGKKV
jgi:hypothetical protein